MTPVGSITLASPAACAIALIVLGAAVAAAFVRRPAVPRLTYLLAALGGLLFALAAGGPVWHRPADDEVLVMVDVSASTRTAQYREPAALRARLGQLLAGIPYRVVTFAGTDIPLDRLDLRAAQSRLADKPGDRTSFAPPAAPAVVLFSDGRFEIPPVLPPTYVIVDPALESPADAAVQRLEADGGDVSATVHNSSGPRELTLSGTEPSSPAAIAAGSLVVTRTISPGTTAVVARLSPGDAWPENDSLSLPAPPPAEAEQWWVSNRPAPPQAGRGWRKLSPSELPTDPGAYLAPSVIVLENVAADDLAVAPAQRLTQYVRDLGGGLLIIGGDRAFGAGGYSGTALESLSPLASTPPEPAAHWVLLVDSSGSMNAALAGGAGRRWRAAADAAVGLLRSLPPNDLVSVGSFAADVSWWSRGRRAAEVARETLPPAGAAPSGPTELRAAIAAVTASAEPAPPTQLVLLTDANADVPEAAALGDAMRRKYVRLHLLAIGEGGVGLGALSKLVTDTGGTLVEEKDPARWAQAARALLRRASPTLLQSRPIRLNFVGDLRALPPRDLSPWNRTWAKAGATLLAEGAATDLEKVPLAARWAVGEGSVAAAAFAGPNAEELEALVRLVSRPPRDPRLRVTWDAGPGLRVTVDAVAGEQYLNGLELTLRLTDPDRAGASGQSLRVPQVAPGRYELAIDAPREPVLASVRLEGRTVDRIAVAGRYAPEFDAVGNDRAAMRELARRSGGAIIEPSASAPLDLARPRRDVPLTSPLAAAGAVCVALGLVRWKMS